jgi:uncharacterized damage-inducible protein DinB
VSLDLARLRDTLARTPRVLDAWLRGLPDEHARRNEGPGTWSAFDVVGHLAHGERTDWIPRARRILEHGTALAFEPFDRFAQDASAAAETLDGRLDDFARLRAASLEQLDALELGPAQLALQGRHPALGLVTLSQLLTTWAVHDLDHLAQTARVLARPHAPEVGPWREYLPITRARPGG